MINFPNAKLNLGLNIVSKRPDGYHNLETVFYPIKICDALEITLSPHNHDELIVDGLTIDSEIENNLVLKAVKLLRHNHKFSPIKLNLLKKIPMGAGIGGGSADGAFTLTLLNEMFELGIDKQTLATYARQLGADCPFFIYNSPQYAEGIGDILEAIDFNIESYHITLVKPNIFISTKEAFSGITPKKSDLSPKEVLKMPVSQWKDHLYNDFEKSIFPKYPELQQIKQELYNQGALYCSMTGSGASIYAISEEPLENLNLFKNHYLWTNK